MRRGRPARLSREAILEAALRLLARGSAEPLTLARVAEEVGAVPAALYRHVGGQAELLDAAVGRALEGVRLEIRPEADWREQVRAWMGGMREHLLRTPGVLVLITRRGRTSPGFLEAVAVLAGILARAGLRGAELARAQLWVAQTTTGLVVEEAALPLPEQLAAARASLPALSSDGRALLAATLPELARLDPDALFAFAVERTLVALADLVPDATDPGA